MGGGTPGANAGPKDHSWELTLGGQQGGAITSASISPNSHHIALLKWAPLPWGYICIYDTSTGQNLVNITTTGRISRFSIDGLNIWSAQESGEAEVWKIGKQNRSEYEGQKTHITSVEGSPWGQPVVAGVQMIGGYLVQMGSDC